MRRENDDVDDGFEVRGDPGEETGMGEEGFRPSRRRRAVEREAPGKAPLLVRVAAWLAVIAFCFVAGYVGTSMALRMLNRKDILERKDVAGNREEARNIVEKTPGEIQLNAKKAVYSIYYPKGGDILLEKSEFISGIMEEDISRAIGKIFDLVPGKFAPDVKLLHTFRNGDTLFLDFSAPFIPSLSALGEKESALFITGIVRTMKDNFSPVTKVRFLVEGKITREGAPVDLTVPWQLPQG